MKSGLKIALFLLLFPGMVLLLSNMVVAGPPCCGVSEVVEGGAGVPAYMEVSPTAVSAADGEVHKVWVTVLDKNKNPLPNVLVTASSDTPNRASVEPEQVKTDERGKAVFTIKGVAYFSGSRAIITFKAGDVAAKVETAQQFL
ncbi:MAG TPA: Ig-like domain-containing protein [Candidatus Hypogeohydataceae bacterium YC41]